MTETARELVDQFDSLSEAERQEVLVELLRRAAFGEHDLPDDVDLLAVRGESAAWHRDRRCARLARRDEGKYRQYLTEKQRRQAGCSAGRMQRDFHHGLLGRPPLHPT